VVQAPGVIFSEADNVIPDVAWVSNARLADSLDEAGHLTVAPELIVECLSYGGDNERRDRQLKLKLYSARGVLAYWIVDWKQQSVEVYERQGTRLVLIETLRSGDRLTCSLLPGFAMEVARLFS
jgi:Uma2 family endonuclease